MTRGSSIDRQCSESSVASNLAEPGMTDQACGGCKGPSRTDSNEVLPHLPQISRAKGRAKLCMFRLAPVHGRLAVSTSDYCDS